MVDRGGGRIVGVPLVEVGQHVVQLVVDLCVGLLHLSKRFLRLAHG